MKKIIYTILFLMTFLFSFSVNSSAEENGYIVKLKDTGGSVALFGAVDTMGMIAEEENINLIDYSEKLFAVKSLDDIPDYISKSSIECIEPDYEVSLFEVPNDTLYSKYQWNMKMINAPAFWESGCYGQDIKIAVVDSGAHSLSDLSANLLEGYNYLSNNTDVTDSTGHGTFVSGIIAASGNNSMGLAGLAYRAKIVPLKCFEGEKTNVSYIIKAVREAVDKYDCKIINLSLGDSKNSSLLEDAVNHAISKGAIVVAASGNSGDDTVYYPASYPHVISVGSVDSNKVIASTSTHNAYVDVVAPGEDVYSLCNSESGIGQGDGTSFAAPHVSALAALCLNINPELNCADFMAILQHTSDDLGDSGRDDYYGYGLINAQKVLKNLLNGMDYFISPYDYETENPSAVVYNNTSAELSFFSIFSDSTKTTLTGISPASKSGVHIYPQTQCESFTHYLWKTNLKPLEKNMHTVPAAGDTDEETKDDDTADSSGESDTAN